MQIFNGTTKTQIGVEFSEHKIEFNVPTNLTNSNAKLFEF